jgi:carbon monoxide dehydrogenase subunit G
MTRINERIATSLGVQEAFDYLSDFANASEWDPGVATAERSDDGPLGVGARFELGIRRGERVVPMTYRITDYEPHHRVVLEGSGSGVHAIDEIRFEANGTGSVVDYTADINLAGLMRLVQPFIGGTFRRIAEDAAGGIHATLESRAARQRDDGGAA